MIKTITTSIAIIFLIHCVFLKTCPAKETRKWLNGVHVVVMAHDKTPHGMTGHKIKKDVLVTHFKEQLKEQLKTSQYSIQFRSTDPHLKIDITITGDRETKIYNIVTKASLDAGAEEWKAEASDYWDKQKNVSKVRKAEEVVKYTKRILFLDKEMVGIGSFSSNIEKIDRENVEEGENKLAKAEKALVKAKKDASLTGTIMQSLNTIASRFSQYYQLVKQYEQEYTRQATETEALQYQLGTVANTYTPQNGEDMYREARIHIPTGILYEAGGTATLYNQADTCFAIYGDPEITNAIILFTNDIDAKIIGYKSLPDKPVVYQVLIALQDGSEYTGWVPEGIIQN